jgi:hypothetical protein
MFATHNDVLDSIPAYREGAEMPCALVFDFRGAKIPYAGRYSITVSSNGSQIGSTDVEAI